MTGAATPIRHRGPDGTIGDGLGRTVPHHLNRKPAFPDSGMLFLEMARVLSHPRPQSHDGGSEAGVRGRGTVWSIPEIHSDQGMIFGSNVVLEVCRLFGIHKTRTTLYHPWSDGFIERSFRTLGQCLKAACRETKQEWYELVLLILMSCRATPQASTGVTPNIIMLGRQTRLPVQAMYGTPLGPDQEERMVSEYVAALQDGLRAAYRHARQGLQQAALHQKHDYDGKVQRQEFQAGELVWVHDITLGRNRGTKLQFPWYGPELITKVLDRGRVVVRRKPSKPLAVVHVDRLEAYRGMAVPAWMTTEQRGCVAV